MAGSMLLWSVLPLEIDVLVGAQRLPLTVGAGIAAGFGVGSLLIRRLHPAYGHAGLSAAGMWRRCRAMGRSAVPNVVVPVAVTSIGAFGYVASAWSSAHIDTAVTSSLYQLWPVMWFVVVRGVDTRRSGSQHRRGVPPRVYALLPVALGGAVMVVTAAGDGSARADGSVVAGMVLAVAAAGLVSATAAHFLAVDRIVFDAGAGPAAGFGDVSVLRLQELVSLLSLRGNVGRGVVEGP